MIRFYKLRNKYYSIFIICLYVILIIIYNSLFFSENLFSQLYEGILTKKQIHASISLVKKWEWALILMNLLVVFLRISFVASFLYLGIFFFSNQSKVFNIALNCALKAEIVFVINAIFRLFWFVLLNTPESPDRMQVMPLSLMHFFDPTVIEPWLIYPLNTLNVFEVIYFWMLSALLAVAIQVKLRKAFEIVFSSYGAGLLLLMVVQMFLIMNNS